MSVKNSLILLRLDQCNCCWWSCQLWVQYVNGNVLRSKNPKLENYESDSIFPFPDNISRAGVIGLPAGSLLQRLIQFSIWSNLIPGSNSPPKSNDIRVASIKVAAEEWENNSIVGSCVDALVVSSREVNYKQDKVNSADSAFIFLIIQSQNQWSGWSGRRRWSCLVWSLLER